MAETTLRSFARFVLRTPVRLTLFLLLAWLAALNMIDDAGGMNVFHDAQFLSAYERHARAAVLDYGEFPFWDPFSCGGMYGLAAPQTRYASPFFALSLALGVDRASALAAVLWLAIGMEGMYRYARSWRATPLAALLCAPLFPLHGFFGSAWQLGWVQFFSFCGLPWILLGLRRALRGDARGALLCGLANALTLGFGASWTLPMGVLLSLCELVDVLARKDFRARLRRAAPTLFAACLWLVCLGAYRFWPMLESLRATLRVMGGVPANSLLSLWQRTFSSAHSENGVAGAYYVAPIVLLSLGVLCRKRAWVLWFAALLTFATGLGEVGRYAPFALLRKLPIYDTLRYPERFLVTFVLMLSLLTAIGTSVLMARLRKRWGRVLGARLSLALCASFALGWGFQVRNTYIRSTADLEASPHEAAATNFRQSRGNRWLMSHFVGEGLGALACGEAYPLPMSRHLRGDLAQEEYLVADEAGRPGSVQRQAWTPHRIALDVDAQRPARLAINQNYHPGWQSDVGQVESWDGLLSVRVPEGAQRVTLRFVPRSGVGGVAVSVLALLTGTFWAYRRALDRRRRLVLLFAAPALWLLIACTWQEAVWTHPEPYTPSGESVIVAALPADTTPLHVQFAQPLSLEGVRVTHAYGELPKDRVVDVDLFMRRSGPLSPSLGVFVHLRGPDGRSVHADHAEVSGTQYLMRLPLGDLARDAFRVAIPPGPAGTWTMHVGLWNPYSDGERIPIRDGGGARVDRNALEAIHFELPN